mmetsp:Transcript_5158/g.22892  ORF Transcript_5158/g.22892 Transcript_5158/m.22892 type:complete len:323 (-) Transcript_5158:4565-5533(-)
MRPGVACGVRRGGRVHRGHRAGARARRVVRGRRRPHPRSRRRGAPTKKFHHQISAGSLRGAADRIARQATNGGGARGHRRRASHRDRRVRVVRRFLLAAHGPAARGGAPGRPPATRGPNLRLERGEPGRIDLHSNEGRRLHFPVTSRRDVGPKGGARHRRGRPGHIPSWTRGRFAVRVGEQAVGANHRGAVHVFQRMGVVPARGRSGDATGNRAGALQPGPRVRPQEDDVRVVAVRHDARVAHARHAVRQAQGVSGQPARSEAAHGWVGERQLPGSPRADLPRAGTRVQPRVAARAGGRYRPRRRGARAGRVRAQRAMELNR